MVPIISFILLNTYKFQFGKITNLEVVDYLAIVTSIFYYGSFAKLIYSYKFYSWYISLLIRIFTDMLDFYIDISFDQSDPHSDHRVITIFMVSEILFSLSLTRNLWRMKFHVTFCLFAFRAVFLLILFVYFNFIKDHPQNGEVDHHKEVLPDPWRSTRIIWQSSTFAFLPIEIIYQCYRRRLWLFK